MEIINLISSKLFDFNYFINSYKHLITKSMVYTLVKTYEPLKSYFFLNLSGAGFSDINESEKYKEEEESLLTLNLIGFNRPRETQ